MAESGIAANAMLDSARLLTFDSTVYRLSAVKKAAYKFGGHFHFLIEQQGSLIKVQLKPKESYDSPDALAGEFCNEVLDQDLRETIAEETAGIRNLLLAQAFSKTSLIDSELETGEYDSAKCAEASGDQ